MLEKHVTREVEPVVAQALAQFPDIVARIRFKLGEDWTGDPAVFFSVLLKDEASREESAKVPNERSKLFNAINKVQGVLDQADTYEYGYSRYYNWRTESEQAKAPNKDYE